MEPEVGVAFVATMRVVQLAGGEVVPVTLPELEHLRVAHLTTISSEMRLSMDAYTKVCHCMTMVTFACFGLLPGCRDCLRAIHRPDGGDPSSASGFWKGLASPSERPCRRSVMTAQNSSC